MRNLFALVGAGTIAFVGLGWYLGWYKVTRQPATPGTQRFNLDVNPDKIATDGKKVIERGGEIISQLSESNVESAASSTENSTQPQPASPSATATGHSTIQKSPSTSPAPPGTIQPVGATTPRP